jgi:hypothetical protein
MPQLEGPRSRGAAKNVKLLPVYVIHRLEQEGAALTADNAERRTDRLPDLRSRGDRLTRSFRASGEAVDFDRR